MNYDLAQPKCCSRLVRIEINRELVVTRELSYRKAVIVDVGVDCQRSRIKCCPPVQTNLAIDFLVADRLKINRGMLASVEEKADRY